MGTVTKRRLWLAAGLFWCLLFLVACLVPNPPSPAGIPLFDKVEHAGAFVVMSVWFGLLYPQRHWRVLLILSGYGAVTELLQTASGYRNGDPLDWLADTVGIVVGLLLARWLARWR